MAASRPKVPRCRKCRRPLRRAAMGFPPIRAYRTRQIPGQTEIPIDDRTLT